MLKPARAKESSQETVAVEARRDSGVVSALSTAGPEPAGEPPRAFRALTVDLDILEDSFSDGALCFLNPLTGEVHLPRKWHEEHPGHVRVPKADKRVWLADFIAKYVTDVERRDTLGG